jgi:8-hydroxy-5-deazaflavin:NADPH oxidoreductase
MKAAVMGTGIVGRVIAERLTSVGHAVTIGTRNVKETLARAEKDAYGNPPFAEWRQLNNSIQLGTYAEAASTADIIFNCTQGQGSVDALKQAGESSLRGKIIIDIANPLDFSKGAPPILSPGNTDSLGELIQRTFPETKVVKTLNTMNCFLMVNPAALSGDHNVFMSGNDAAAKATAKEILNSFGWRNQNIIDLGDISTARGTEQLLPIWIRLYGTLKTGMFNFNIVK